MAAVVNDDDFNAPIEADDTSFSDIGDDGSFASSSQSLSSSIMDHVYENGRRYHRKSEGKYSLPSDETEQDRLDLTHHTLLLVLGGKLCVTEFESDPHRVLDCGTGTGIWALDFGETHPGSEVLGCDLAPMQPSWTYPNVKFELDDLEKEWTWKKNHFDFIHARTIGTGIRNWPRLIKRMFDHTVPGGRVEIGEHPIDQPECDDGTLPKGSCIHQYFDAVSKALAEMGVNSKFHTEDYVKYLEEAGYVDVQVRKFKVPWGRWPKNKVSKEQGTYSLETPRTGLEAYGLALMTRSGMTREDASTLIKETFETLESGRYHVYQWYYVMSARKPE